MVTGGTVIILLSYSAEKSNYMLLVGAASLAYFIKENANKTVYFQIK